jgi:hypothetical protein
MGLDSIWKMPDEQDHPVFEPNMNLCGGLFSGFGQGSFRGKVYNEFIEYVSGISLYQEEMSNTDVRKVARSLATYDSRSKDLVAFEITPAEIDELTRMFTKYGDAGATLVGWW